MFHDGRSIYASLADALESDWRSLARPEQLAPEGDWSTWLILAGRGAGKTRSGAEWVRSIAEAAQVARLAGC
jgi:phage terminase large subunit-like protein